MITHSVSNEVRKRITQLATAHLVDLYVSYRSVYCGPQCQHQRSESDVSADDGPKEIVADFNLTDS